MERFVYGLFKMKIVILSKYPLDGISGGPSVHRDKFIYHISQIRDIELHIVTFSNKNIRIKNDLLNIHMIKKYKITFFSIPITLLVIVRKIMKINPDIVHALGTFIPWSIIAALLRNKYPTIVTLYGIASEELIKFRLNISHFYALFSVIYEKYIIRNMNIIVPTVSIKNLINKNINSKIYVVPYGIEFGKIQKIKPYDIGKPDIFLVANLEKVKGVDILIKAIPKIIKLVPDLSVYIAGSGDQENELKKIVKRLNVEKHVKFLGFISENEKYQYYKASKIVVIPSRWDVAPLTLYEAMASGKPVVASNIGGIPDVVDDGKTGFLFETENVKDLANKIIILLIDRKLREEMGKAAKEKARQYEWSKIMEKTIEIYKEVITDFHKKKINVNKGSL